MNALFTGSIVLAGLRGTDSCGNHRMVPHDRVPHHARLWHPRGATCLPGPAAWAHPRRRHAPTGRPGGPTLTLKSSFSAFRRGLREARLRGGTDHPPGAALRRVAVGPAPKLRPAELVQLKPDVMVTNTTPGCGGQAGDHDYSHCCCCLGRFRCRGHRRQPGAARWQHHGGQNLRDSRASGLTRRAVEGSCADAHPSGRPRPCG